MLPIEDELTPERYEVQRCLTHKKHILDEICKHCRKMFCKRCETKQLCLGQVLNWLEAEKSTKGNGTISLRGENLKILLMYLVTSRHLKG